MITLNFPGTFKTHLLFDQVRSTFPGLVDPTQDEPEGAGNLFFIYPGDGEIAVELPDTFTQLEAFNAVVTAHDPEEETVDEARFRSVQEIYGEMAVIPAWSLWSANQAHAEVTGMVLSGMTRDQANAWVDANITGTSVATLKPQLIAAIKILAGGIIDLRDIAALMAKMVMWLRDILLLKL